MSKRIDDPVYRDKDKETEFTNRNICSDVNNNSSILYSKARQNLAAELDAIDAQFERQQKFDEITAPDGIRMRVDREEEKQFDEENNLDYDDESIYPIEEEQAELQSNIGTPASEADTVRGEEVNLNDSFSSSMVITFKNNKLDNQLEMHDVRTGVCELEKILTSKTNNIAGESKKIEEMMPDELVEANPALKQLMTKLLQQNRDGVKENKPRQTKETSKSSSNGNEGNKKLIAQIHSPSDTTIYALALKLTPPGQNQGLVKQFLNAKGEEFEHKIDQNKTAQNIPQIVSDFLEQV